ncbi:hypothetical protein [Citreimonas sp.]|uniref:hypothetical protein n=1 Tax=Citreimonas sp. TaxID=3036715 RepID=UPI0040585B3B
MINLPTVERQDRLYRLSRSDDAWLKIDSQSWIITYRRGRWSSRFRKVVNVQDFTIRVDSDKSELLLRISRCPWRVSDDAILTLAALPDTFEACRDAWQAHGLHRFQCEIEARVQELAPEEDRLRMTAPGVTPAWYAVANRFDTLWMVREDEQPALR